MLGLKAESERLCRNGSEEVKLEAGLAPNDDENSFGADGIGFLKAVGLFCSPPSLDLSGTPLGKVYGSPPTGGTEGGIMGSEKPTSLSLAENKESTGRPSLIELSGVVVPVSAILDCSQSNGNLSNSNGPEFKEEENLGLEN